MLMSVSYHKTRGFTLIELVVVLSLMAILLAVAATGVITLYESINRSIKLQEVVNDINGLGREAWQSRESFSLSDKVSKLPVGWSIEEEVRILYSAKGACSGGKITILKGKEVMLRQELEPPFCQLDYEN